jgi:hypothetical protein
MENPSELFWLQEMFKLEQMMSAPYNATKSQINTLNNQNASSIPRAGVTAILNWNAVEANLNNIYFPLELHPQQIIHKARKVD